VASCLREFKALKRRAKFRFIGQMVMRTERLQSFSRISVNLFEESMAR
jgi:hypothetical protein